MPRTPKLFHTGLVIPGVGAGVIRTDIITASFLNYKVMVELANRETLAFLIQRGYIF